MWALIKIMLVAFRLRAAAHELPDIDHPEYIDPFVDAAFDEETPRAPAALLIALGWGESRFDPRVRSGVVCGAMQVNPLDLDQHLDLTPSQRQAVWKAECDEWTSDMHAGMRAGVREIEMMLADKRVGGNLRAALLYRACGNSAFDGTCSGDKYAWVNEALERYRKLDGKAHGRTPRPSS